MSLKSFLLLWIFSVPYPLVTLFCSFYKISSRVINYGQLFSPILPIAAPPLLIILCPKSLLGFSLTLVSNADDVLPVESWELSVARLLRFHKYLSLFTFAAIMGLVKYSPIAVQEMQHALLQVCEPAGTSS